MDRFDQCFLGFEKKIDFASDLYFRFESKKNKKNDTNLDLRFKNKNKNKNTGFNFFRACYAVIA